MKATEVGLVLLVLGCGGDPYARYAATVHQDVDAAMVAAFRMTARLQLTVVRTRIPTESLAVAADIVTRAASEVHRRATHFAQVTAPPELARVHADLSLELSHVALALDSMGAAFQRCAAQDPTCQAQLDSLGSRFGFVGEDLSTARGRVQRLLLSHGIMLRPISAARAFPPGRAG